MIGMDRRPPAQNRLGDAMFRVSPVASSVSFDEPGPKLCVALRIRRLSRDKVSSGQAGMCLMYFQFFA